jgi:signal transduction histidine kinase
MRRSLTLSNGGFGLALVVLVGSAVLSYRNGKSMSEAAEGRRLTFVRLDQRQELLAAMVDIETGLRGYVITGDENFLEPYHSGLEQMERHLKRLRAELADDAGQQPELAELVEAVTQEISHSHRVVSLKSTQQDDSAQRAIATGDGKQIMDHIRQIIALQSSRDREQLQQRDQEFQSGLSWRVQIIVVGSLFGFVAVFLAAAAINRSLGERIRLNADLRRSLAETMQALDKVRVAEAELTRSNQELNQFAYVASHDLQEPLRKVSSFAQMLASQYKGKLDAEADEFIGYMIDGSRRMQTLIQNLLTYSRLGHKRPPLALTNGDSVLKRSLENLQGAVEESGAVVTSDPLPIILADEGQLVQLFQNLIGNAIKFHGADKPLIHIRAEPNGLEWTFSVRDNGIGIDLKFADRIFVIFQRLHSREDYPGTGIGLALCKKIVERHEGRIWIESRPGHGTTFFFTLPRLTEKDRQTNERPYEREHHDRNLVGR